MKPDVMLQKLEEAATQLSVKVSYEVMSVAMGHGGLCRVKGEYRVIIDKRASTEERSVTLASSLSRVLAANPANIELADNLRELIEQQSMAPASRPAAPPRGRARAA
ncbi:MAG TPA: hypothetical protein VM261_34690 [Kofleriaceae bacterium]|nr:hypothetical protein [Kofleriaceae bacterium]